MEEVVIVAAVRTPIGSFLGGLSGFSASDLGAVAIKGLFQKVNVDPALVEEVIMGQVLQAGEGQAPARQAAIKAGLSNTIPCTTVNKVCSSGMKAVSLAVQAIACGDISVAVAGGMESMSNVPHYGNLRSATKLGDAKFKDGLVLDGLTDVYNEYHMGVAAELCAKECKVSREDQDAFAIESYRRASKAWEKGYFQHEVIPVSIPQRKSNPIDFSEDEEYRNVFPDKVPQLRPVFQKDGTVTAANASTLNDGAAALLLMSKTKADELGLTPMATILSHADYAHEPEWFTTAPAKAIPKAIQKAGLTPNDIDYYELNEAFSVVALANNRILNLDANKVNVHGGAVALGHPLGCSGARILVTLIHVLQQHDGKIGVAGICNGGGGASAMVLKI